MNSELLCKDCKHRFRQLSDFPVWGSGVEWRCRRAFVPASTEYDPVLGSKKNRAHYRRCSLVRLHDADYNKDCGKEGQWWEPKNKRFLFLQIKHSDKVS